MADDQHAEKTKAKWEDPRLDPRQIPFLQYFASQHGKTRRIDEVTYSYEQLVAFSNKRTDLNDAKEAMLMQEQESYNAISPPHTCIRREGTFVSQPDGNIVRFCTLRPKKLPPKAKVPGIIYFHGGGMLTGSCFYAHYQAWGRLLALGGFCVVLVDFRNALVPGIRKSAHSSGETARYPGGLNDCVSSVKYVHEHADEFGIDQDNLFLAGESGGGNLCLSTAIKLNNTGHMHLVRGLYALCPFVAGNYPNDKLPTTVQNNGIFLLLDGLPAHMYGIDAFRERDPCAWPIFATAEDLAGLPPVMVSCNECDPLLDEGLTMYRNMRDAGVAAQARVVVGTCHAGELLFCMPEVTLATARSVKTFIEDIVRLGVDSREHSRL